MARKSGSRSIPTSPSYADNRLAVRSDLRIRSALQLLEDHRVFHPEGAFRSPLSISSPRKSRLVVRNANFNKPNRLATLGFEAPKRVIRCVRRKVRKEVLIAKKRSGRGTRKRFNHWSAISC